MRLIRSAALDRAEEPKGEERPGVRAAEQGEHRAELARDPGEAGAEHQRPAVASERHPGRPGEVEAPPVAEAQAEVEALLRADLVDLAQAEVSEREPGDGEHPDPRGPRSGWSEAPSSATWERGRCGRRASATRSLQLPKPPAPAPAARVPPTTHSPVSCGEDRKRGNRAQPARSCRRASGPWPRAPSSARAARRRGTGSSRPASHLACFATLRPARSLRASWAVSSLPPDR